MGRKLLLLLVLVAPLGFYPFLRGKPPEIHRYTGAETDPLSRDEKMALGCFSILPGHSFPAAFPWIPLREVGQAESRALEELAAKKPIAFLEHCLHHYEKTVQGYRLIFVKQEKVNGKLRPKEVILVHFREKPFSVHMDWKEGIGKAARTLYVEGENKGMLLARPFLEFLPVMAKKVDSPEAKATSRFPITEFGIYIGAKRTLDAMREADKNGTLSVRYEGIERLAQVGNRLCYKLVRTPYSPPEDDGVNELTIYIDQETLLQVGSILRDSQGELIADYFFRDIELNPTFSENQFTDKAL